MMDKFTRMELVVICSFFLLCCFPFLVLFFHLTGIGAG